MMDRKNVQVVGPLYLPVDTQNPRLVCPRSPAFRPLVRTPLVARN